LLYKGFKNIVLETESEHALLYERSTENRYNCLTNEYLILHNEAGEVIDKLKWTGSEYKPLAYKQLSNDYSGKIAAVIVAADYRAMELGRDFYPWLRSFCDRIGALLIFDEIVTGFRMAIGGVQEYFGVTPDLAVFAKAIANGMPLSVYCGKSEYMDVLQTAVVSSTYAGDALSLAAAKTVMEIYSREPVIEHLWSMARMLWGNFNTLAKKYNMPVSVPEPINPIARFVYSDSSIEDFPNRFRRACYNAGISFYEGGYVNYSHKLADVEETLEKVESVFKTF